MRLKVQRFECLPRPLDPVKNHDTALTHPVLEDDYVCSRNNQDFLLVNGFHLYAA